MHKRLNKEREKNTIIYLSQLPSFNWSNKTARAKIISLPETVSCTLFSSSLILSMTSAFRLYKNHINDMHKYFIQTKEKRNIKDGTKRSNFIYKNLFIFLIVIPRVEILVYFI